MAKVNKPSFTKEQIVKSDRYHSKVDMVSALLDDSKTYTLEEVDAVIEEFLKGKVN